METLALERGGKFERLNKNGRKRKYFPQGGFRRIAELGDGVLSGGESRKKMVFESPRGVDVGELDGVADSIFFGGGQCRKGEMEPV